MIIEENTDFNDTQKNTQKQLVRLISISKIEEFAVLVNDHIDRADKEKLENMPFIERLPLGIYHFSLLSKFEEEAREKNCDILVYSNLKQPYADLMNALPTLVAGLKAPVADYLSEAQLQVLSATIESQIFFGHDLYPGYSLQDIKDIVQYYYQSESLPSYIELQDRAKFDVTNVAKDILAGVYSRSQEEVYKSQLWDENESQWKTFFGHDKKYFLNEVDLAIRRISNPDLYQRPTIIPTDRKELRRLEELPMGEIREQNPAYWKWLSDQVYEKHRDAEGYYQSSEGDYRSKNKLDFQLDHITAISNGGLTTFEKLQLLTRKQNAVKGAR